jgi:DNA-binding HxlR family transcriptional regulator
MLGSDYNGQVCSVARSLEVIGERWTILVLRDAFLGLRRFDEFQSSLGIARNVLATRLDRLVEHGVMEKRLYQEHPPRYEYRLTDVGRDLWPVVVSLMQWGDRHAPADGGPPTVVEHRDCGGTLANGPVCDRCGAALTLQDVVARPGPGAPPAHPLLRSRYDGEPIGFATEP